MKRSTTFLFLSSTIVTFAAASQAEEIELDKVTTQAPAVTESQPETRKLLVVPGAGNDPLRALESLPGVVFGKGNDARPAVRGSSPDDNAYYLDFLPVGYLFHNDGSSILSDSLTDEFQLYPAAFGPEFNGATGAVITAESRSPLRDSQQIIDLSLLRAGFLIDQPVSDDQGFYLSGRMSLFQYYLKNIVDSDDFEFTTVPEFYDYQGSYEYRPSDLTSVRFQFVGARDKAGLDFTEESDFTAQDPALTGGLEAQQMFNSQGVVIDSVSPSGLSSRIGISHLEQAFDFTLGEGNYIDANSHRYGIRSEFSYPLGLDHEVSWGLEYSERLVDYRGLFKAPPCDEFTADCRLVRATETLQGSGTLRIRQTDLFIKDTWNVTARWQLIPGLHLSDDSYTGNQYVEPRISQGYQLTDALRWTLGYGRYHSMPANPGQYTPEFGNPDLDETRATHYVTGLEAQLRDGLMLTTELYYKDITDIIVARPADTSDGVRYNNDASGRAFGIEMLLNADFSERWYGWTSVTLSRTERSNDRTGEDFRYSYDQPLVINMVASYRASDIWTLGLKWRYQSGQLVTPLEGAEEDPDTAGLYNPIYGDPFSERLPSYHRLDFRADRSFRFSNADMDLYFEVINLYARENVVGYRYLNADYSEREDVTDLPPLASVGVRLLF